MSDAIPVEIEVAGSQFKKGLGWTTIGMTAGALIASSIEAIVGLATQGKSQKCHYVIKFSDGTQKVITCDSNKLQLDLIIWSWKINNQKTENDYVTFEMDFSTLRRGIIIPISDIRRLLGTSSQSAQSTSEARQRFKIEQESRKFLKLEIQRYFKEQRKDTVIVEETMGGGFKIPSKSSEVVWGMAGLVAIVAMFGGCIAEMSSPKQASKSQSSTQAEQATNDTYECAATEGVGETINRGDIVNLGECMRDKGYAIDPYR